MNFAPGTWRFALPPLIGVPIVALYSIPGALVVLGIGAFVLLFFRDPTRNPPLAGVLAPADGRVSVLRTETGRVRLGTFMNVWNVHVVRSPFAGTVDEVEHVPGAHRPAFSKDSDRNERVHVRYRPETDETVDEQRREVTLIAGAFARRITPYVEPGEEIERGQRIGHIAFGSRVDVVFPSMVSIEEIGVETGEKVTAGETVVFDTENEAETDVTAQST